MATVAVILVVVGCGRIGFDPRSDAAHVMPSLVAVSQASGAAVSSLIVPTPTIGSGHLVIAAVLIGGSEVTGVTDDGPVANTFVSAGALCILGLSGTEIWYAKNTLAGATSVTASFSAASGPTMWIVEISGIDPGSPLDQVAMATLAPGPIAVAPTVTTTTPDTVVISAIKLPTGNVVDAANPFTAFPIVAGDDAAYVIAPTPGSYGAVWDVGTQAAACASTVSFRPALL